MLFGIISVVGLSGADIAKGFAMAVAGLVVSTSRHRRHDRYRAVHFWHRAAARRD